MNYVGALICATAAAATLYGPRGGIRRRIYTADGLYLYPALQNASYFDQIHGVVGGVEDQVRFRNDRVAISALQGD